MREPRPVHAPLEVRAERVLRSGPEDVVLGRHHQVRDLHQLVDVVVREVDVMGDARAEARVRAEEVVHPVLVTGEDHDQLVPLGLHHLQQDLDRLAAVVALVLRLVEVVGLVDEEDAAVGAAEHLLRLRRRVADVLADEVVARAGDDARLLDVAEPVQDLCHLQCDGRLARPRVAREGHVQRRALGGEPHLGPQPVDQEQRRDLPDAGLDRPERDQLAVELVEHLEDVRLREGGLQIGTVADLGVGLVLVDVVLLRLRRRRQVTVRRLRRPHPEFEAHSAAAPLAEPLVDGLAAAGSTWTRRKLCVRPGPWIRSSL